jgi:DUF971 family protein
MKAPAVPTEIRRLGDQAVRIVWSDDHQSEYPNVYLRDNCPCALCRQGSRGLRVPATDAKGGVLRVERIGVVGRYALKIEWSDGHDTGIYSYEWLRELCPCERCRSVATRTSETTE